MFDVTKDVSVYVNEHGISLKFICEKTGLSKNVVYPSLSLSGTRKLRVDEFFIICEAIAVDPATIAKLRIDQPDRAS